VKQLAKNNQTVIPDILPDVPLAGDVTCKPKAEAALAYGRWGKPRCLLDAKYDFLLLEATVVSTLDSRDRVDIGSSLCLNHAVSLFFLHRF